MKTKLKHEDGNVAIALMLGWKRNFDTFTFDESLFLHSISNIFIEDLKFHSDWNWLMEAVVYIESIKNNDDYNYQVYIQNNHCCIMPSNHLVEYGRVFAPSKIEATFKAVSEFALVNQR